MALKIIGVPSSVRAGNDLTLFAERATDPALLDGWQLTREDFLEEAVGRYGHEQSTGLEAGIRIGHVSLEAMTKPNYYWLSHWVDKAWQGHGIATVACRAIMQRLTETGSEIDSYQLHADFDDQVIRNLATSLGIPYTTRKDAGSPQVSFSVTKDDFLRVQDAKEPA
jgi:GNAT superfamily N-acetyltransferase